MPLQVGRRVRLQAPFLAVLAVLIAAVVYLTVEPSHWRRGAGIIGSAVLLAALLRLSLSRPRAGLLAIRNRGLDTVCYLLLGGLILLADIRLPH
jgi:hypothetical protein